MSASTAFRRTLLTSARIARPTPTTLRRNLYQNSPRYFSATANMSTGGVHNLQTKAAFDEALNTKGSLMVVDCFATWCGPCKVIAPQVVKFSDKYTNARFYKIDVDELPEVAQELSIRAMPTFLLFKDGEKVGEVVGANTKALEAAIEEHAK